MKKYTIVLAVLALFLAAMCVCPVSADVLSDYATDYDESTQKVHAKITLTGGEEGARASEYPKDFVILMDVSLSMRDVYENKSRFECAQNATFDFLQSSYAYKSRVGVVTFSDDTAVTAPLNFNFEEVKRSIEKSSCHGFSTNYGEGIQKAVLILKERDREALPVIIMLTDGGEDKGATSVKNAVDLAMEEGVMIFVVSFGDREMIEEVMLREKVAEQTGGEYRYTSFEGLSDALIKVPKMEEFLSAANLRILILQSDDAVLDHLSIEEMVSPGVVLSRKGYFEFVSPKLTPGKKIELEFDAFSAKKGMIDAGIVNVSYVGKDGTVRVVSEHAYHDVPPLPFYKSPLILAIIVLLLFILLVFTKVSSRHKMGEKYRTGEKAKKESLRKVEDKVTELRGSVEDELGSYKKIMSERLREKFDDVFKIIEEEKIGEEKEGDET